jgi:8-oxo-dGTP diphosphatase
MPKLYLVRHAAAGDRKRWNGKDEARPLTKRGSKQADAIARQLARRVDHVVSSPYARCSATMVPLAKRAGVALGIDDRLAEGEPLAGALEVVEQFPAGRAALCSHGDILGALLTHYLRLGVRLDDDRLAKGSVWVLDLSSRGRRAGKVVSAHYVPPPT